jgi:flotillin
VLNGGEGVNKMLGGILAQVGDYLPALASALAKNRESREGRAPKRPPQAPEA